MGKNIKMLKCFFKVMLNNREEIEKIVPNMYVKNIYKIDYEFLKKRNIKNLIFDIDNTLVPVDDINVPEKLIDLFNNLKQDGFGLCIMSNNSKERVLPIAEGLNISYLYEAKKPKKEAFDKALEILSCDKEETAMVGDQMMSDIKGASEYGLYTILTDPVSNKQNLKTKTSRILQDVMEKHLAKKKVFEPKKYYIKER